MNFANLRYQAARLAMELELKFPVIRTDKRSTTFVDVGHHHWQFYRELPWAWELWWECDGETSEMTHSIPDVWTKGNGGWEIVY